jgi:hypothetical protein
VVISMKDLVNEEWRPIPGFPYYEASSMGRIRSVDREIQRLGRNGKLHPLPLKGSIISPVKRGLYHAVTVRSEKGRSIESVHRLVACAFLETAEGKDFVNHINEDKLDNRVSNLEWCDLSYNQSFSKSKWEYLLRKGEEKIKVVNVRKFCRDNEGFNSCGFYRVRKGLQKSINGWEVTYKTLD